MRYQAVMFDLDGTLADTLADIAAAANYALAQLHQSARPLDDYLQLVGRGAERLFIDALPADQQHLVPQATRMLKAYYAEHGHPCTKPYPGVVELLDVLARRGLTLAVLSNKPHEATCDTVARLFGDSRFTAVRGHQPPTPLKPDPTAPLEICRMLNIAPSQWLYLGDTDVDMQTAVNAGFHGVGVLWGFRDEKELRDNGAQTIIAQPMELLALL